MKGLAQVKRDTAWKTVDPAGARPLPGRQHSLDWPAAAGRRDEQLARLTVQAQRPGEQHGGVLAGGAIDAALQVTDRPLAHPGRLSQLVLGQPGLGPQLPQQPAET